MNDEIAEWMSGQEEKGRDIHKGRLHSRKGKAQRRVKGQGPLIVSVYDLTVRAMYRKNFS
jgi:hypothetical protein